MNLVMNDAEEVFLKKDVRRKIGMPKAFLTCFPAHFDFYLRSNLIKRGQRHFDHVGRNMILFHPLSVPHHASPLALFQLIKINSRLIKSLVD